MDHLQYLRKITTQPQRTKLQPTFEIQPHLISLSEAGSLPKVNRGRVVYLL